jgi:hypothetical protein
LQISSAISISASVGAPNDRPRGRFLHGLHHVRVGVADDRRPPRADVVDIALAVGIPEVRAFGAGDEARRAAHRTEGAHRRVDAAGVVFWARSNSWSFLKSWS